MGSTVTTRQMITAFESSQGPRYIAWSKDYEKNVFPHVPTWSCRAIGRFEDVLDRIFRDLPSCENGMLQGPLGWITPEEHLADWYEAFRQPRLQPECTVSVTFWPTSEKYAEVCNALRAIRREDLLSAEGAPLGIELSLYLESDEISALFGLGGVFPAWRALDANWARMAEGYEVEETLARNIVLQTPDPRTLPELQVRKLDGEMALYSFEGAPYISARGGWASDVIPELLSEHLMKSELQAPGFLKVALPVYRAIVRDAVPADVDTTILTVARPPADQVWATENALKLYRATIDQQAQTLPDRFTTTLLKVFRHDAVNELHWLDPIYVSWAVDQQKQAA